MSGIIGGVGSRSGIVGSTEIPGGYEEGTFNSSPMSFVTDGSVTMHHYSLKYTRIGRVVTCVGNLYVDTVTGQDGALKLTLPFTSADSRTAPWTTNYNDTYPLVFKIEASAAFATLVSPTSWGTRTISNGETYVVGFSYTID